MSDYPMMDKLIELADREGLNLQKLAERIGTSPRRIGRWRNGGSPPPEFLYLCELLVMFEAHGLNLSELFDLVDDWRKKKERISKLSK